ncbi:uncharacterized protein LOC111714905 [Eurytemora carolleeae]|uniref:uncharacterized protein LOC111714905 n=1 Tax=Eurytemora carolleeae TaxID=1294199 RepID=UPI000C76CD62|nr:uncharacterized protein LOC111714905 [Eurytemora carolleeae]|eukprot:XP_023345891.1 uncharacterized protein LOC111714905 [Eurytemora affinis]
MVADKKDDAGLFGWKNWTIPEHPSNRSNITPRPGIDGSTDGNSFMAEKPMELPGEMYNPVKYPNMSPAWSLHTMFISPFLKTIFTDIFGSFSHGGGFLCEKFELSAMECMEYYGVKQGLTACRDYYDDMMECKFNVKKFFHYFYFYNAFL